MSQFNEKGYTPKTQNEYHDELTQNHKEIDPNWRTERNTPDGQKIDQDAEIFGNVDEAIQHCYDSRNPNAAIGYDLDIIASLTQTFRGKGTYSTVFLKITGEIGATIPKGSLFDSGDGTPQFQSTSDSTIGVSKNITIQATCTERGAINANVGEINRIPIVISGVTAVTNESVPTVGLDAETDEELRIRRVVELAKNSNSQFTSIISNINSVSGVTEVQAFENFSQSTNDKGMEAHSAAFIVKGGSDYDVAKAIYQKRCVGIPVVAVGSGDSVTVEVYDEYESNARDITFSRPSFLEMNVSVTIKRGSNLDDQTKEIIKDYILLYSTGQPINGVIYRKDGYKMGEKVVASDLITPINLAISTDRGAIIQEILINEKKCNEYIELSFDQQALFLKNNIGIFINESE